MTRHLSDLFNRPFVNDPVIAGVTADSRKVTAGWLFAALPGTKVDGRDFAPGAVAKGAAAVLAPEGGLEGLGVPVVRSEDARRAYALASAAFWGKQPAMCVAVTGTNGKTSVAGFCRQIFAKLGHRAASMGTLGVVVSEVGQPDQQLTPPGLTTPDAGDVAEMVARLADMGVTHLALEASSHGVDQRRVDGVKLRAAGFTNFTQDHLDYHGSMEAYRAAKLRLFDTLTPNGGTAVLNADSDAFPNFAAAAVTSGQSVFSVGEDGQGLRLISRTPTPAGQDLVIEAEDIVHHIKLPLAGAFQASNVLVAAGLCIAAGEDVTRVLKALETLEGAAGRLQRVGRGSNGGEAYVDYAHTPDGLQTVLEALRPHTRGKLIAVFGAGGDRDRTKRPLMGAIGARLADIAIVTDDNPRSEDPASIRAAILEAAPGAREIGDRRAAIRAAVELMNDGDVLVVAGKGHEQGQIVAGVVHPFDDVAETLEALEGVDADAPSQNVLWTADEIAKAVGGKVAGDFVVTGVSIDTRTVEAGDLFVPLVGARDGHDFVPQAVAAGAAGVLAAKAVDAPAVVVDDTFKALEALGVAARERAPGCKRGAVTGSVGKTSVTRAVEAGLRLAGRAHASVKSYNNHIGVPLTLARMPRDTERAVFEIGMNHADEITPLSDFVRPHAVAITTVGPVHLENFADGEAGVARAKAEIFAGLEPGGVAVLNADNRWFDLLKAEAERAGATVWSFGEAAGATARLTGFSVEGEGATVSIELRGETIRFPIRQTGVHWGPNSLCVLLMLEALDVSRETALAALAAFQPIEGRGAEKTIRIDGGSFTLVDESYNANPVSMQAALRTLGARKVAGRRVAVLTDMLELGEGSERFHAELAAPIDHANVDIVFLAGVHMKSLWEALPPTRRGSYAEVTEKLTATLAGAIRPGDVVMVKGSNGSRAGVLAAALAALDLKEQD